jgi:hypothetical protein
MELIHAAIQQTRRCTHGHSLCSAATDRMGHSLPKTNDLIGCEAPPARSLKNIRICLKRQGHCNRYLHEGTLYDIQFYFIYLESSSGEVLYIFIHVVSI